MIQGKSITLRSARLDERKLIFYIAMKTDILNFSESYNSTFEEFEDDYAERYFDSKEPSVCGGMMICENNAPVGFISYCQVSFGQDGINPGIMEPRPWKDKTHLLFLPKLAKPLISGYFRSIKHTDYPCGMRLLTDTLINILTLGVSDFYPDFVRLIFRENVSINLRIDASCGLDYCVFAHVHFIPLSKNSILLSQFIILTLLPGTIVHSSFSDPSKSKSDN